MENFFPYYQPIIDLTDGKIKGYEALGRMISSGEVVTAGPLISSGSLPQEQALEIDRHIRKLALQKHHEDSDAGFLTINISPIWIEKLEENSVVPTITMIEEIGIDPKRIIIEITEIGGDISKLKRLRALYREYGLKVAVDDFGAGASQLDRVAELEPDFIKLDMGMLKNACKGGFKADVALSLGLLTRRSGCQIICEGVETEEEFHFAIECGADFIQGWIFHPALKMSISTDSTVETTKELKASYLNRKRELVNRAISHNRLIFSTVKNLAEKIKACGAMSCEQCLITNRLGCNEIEEAMKIGVLRYYICTMDADQVSPNYELSDGKVKLNPDFSGRNWSHRPYFPLALELRQLKEGRVVLSDPYRDRTLGKLTKTYMASLSLNHILMVDVLVEDTILFANQYITS